MTTRNRTSIVRTSFMHSAWSLIAISLSGGVLADGAEPLQDELMDFSLEELLSVGVTSVSRRAQSLSTAAAAIFVMPERDIRRS